ncbi:MAG: anhydro-N-acetylmuramic acid kinase [Elusimicrobiota bacterium]|jgi:anhydro-N-acetylmuramic acid kinase|nr:anhydro-N-acetylmuramic acid kinase [Elusimicrobiota bacterium]
MKTKTTLALGLMSGTSADGLTICLFDINAKRVIHFKTYPYSKQLQLKILNAINLKTPALASLNFELGRLYANLAKKFIREFKINKNDVAVVGSHGQTVYHQATGKNSCTLQIGEAAFLSEALNIPVVANFRPKDMASGGQGAPLIPAFDEFMFGNLSPLMLLNIGGISNISIVGKKVKTFGFDIGPGNALIDSAVLQLTKGKKTYDKDGKLAAQNLPNTKKAKELAKLFIKNKPPKALERSNYGNNFINKYFKNIQPQDIATITYLTALIISTSIKKFIPASYKAKKLIVSGGGAYNKTLLKYLADNLPSVEVKTLQAFGVDPMAKEAAAFAWLAWQRLNKKPASCPNATGAVKKVVLGSII